MLTVRVFRLPCENGVFAVVGQCLVARAKAVLRALGNSDRGSVRYNCEQVRHETCPPVCSCWRAERLMYSVQETISCSSG